MPNALSEQGVAAEREGSAGRASHPVQAVLSLVSLLLGVVAFVLGVLSGTHAGSGLHFAASCAGGVGFCLGMYSQLVSATTAQRWLNVLGIGGAFVGLGLGLAHGGFSI